MENNIKYGGVYWCDIPSYSSNILNKIRPCVIVSNDFNNEGSHTVNILPITTRIKKPNLPCHVMIDNEGENAMIKAEQIITIDKSLVFAHIRDLEWYELKAVKESLLSQIGIL